MGPEFAALVARFCAGEVVNVSAELRRLGGSRSSFYSCVARFRAEGVAGLYPRSRRPLTSPSAIHPAIADAVVLARKRLDEQGWDAGADQILFWLADHPHQWQPSLPAGVASTLPSRASINRILDRRGQIVRVPQRRPRRSRRRFEAAQPNTMWQMDGFQFRLLGGQPVVILQIIDDCSRFDLALRAAPSENGPDVWAAFVHASQRHGLPANFLTDNGRAFSGRRRGWISRFEENLHALGVHAITSSVGHPQTCGKTERAHATVLKWLARRPPPATLAGLQTLLDSYQDHYNHHRRKTHLAGMTPAQRYALGPFDGPGPDPLTWPVTIRSATVSTSGCIGTDHHLLGIGRRWAKSQVTVIRRHRQIAVFADNQLIAQFTLTGRRGYQPKNP